MTRARLLLMLRFDPMIFSFKPLSGLRTLLTSRRSATAGGDREGGAGDPGRWIRQRARWLVLAAVSSALSLGPVATACSSEECNDANYLYTNWAFGYYFTQAVEDGACTIYGVAVRDGYGRAMECLVASTEDGEELCNCYGGDEIGSYQVYIYSLESSELVDYGEVDVIADAISCRATETIVPFGQSGGGGAGGAGGMGGTSGSD